MSMPSTRTMATIRLRRRRQQSTFPIHRNRRLFADRFHRRQSVTWFRFGPFVVCSSFPWAGQKTSSKCTDCRQSPKKFGWFPFFPMETFRAFPLLVTTERPSIETEISSATKFYGRNRQKFIKWPTGARQFHCSRVNVRAKVVLPTEAKMTRKSVVRWFGPCDVVIILSEAASCHLHRTQRDETVAAECSDSRESPADYLSMRKRSRWSLTRSWHIRMAKLVHCWRCVTTLPTTQEHAPVEPVETGRRPFNIGGLMSVPHCNGHVRGRWRAASVSLVDGRPGGAQLKCGRPPARLLKR